MRIALPVALLVGIGLAWQLLVDSRNMSPQVLPGPWRVVQAGWGARAALWDATNTTLVETLLGTVFAVLAAVLVAALLTFVPRLRQAALPLLIGAQSIPIIVVAPLFVIWFGFGLWPKVLLIVVVTMLPVTISTLQGLLAADPDAVTLLRSMGASRLQVFLRLRVPTAVPHFITGLRVLASFAVIAAIFSEYVGAVNGLGIYMQTERNLLRTDLVFAAVAVSILIGLALFAATYLLEALLMPWERRRKLAAR